MLFHCHLLFGTYGYVRRTANILMVFEQSDLPQRRSYHMNSCPEGREYKCTVPLLCSILNPTEPLDSTAFFKSHGR